MFESSVFPSPASKRWEETEVVPIFSPARTARAHRRPRNRALRPRKAKTRAQSHPHGRPGEP